MILEIKSDKDVRVFWYSGSGLAKHVMGSTEFPVGKDILIEVLKGETVEICEWNT